MKRKRKTMKEENKNLMKSKFEELCGFDTYKYLCDNLKKVNVAQNEDFRTKFNSYFKVRRNQDWQSRFYSYLEDNKEFSDIGFDDILDWGYKNLLSIKSNSNMVEASFCSKMLSIINPDKPVLDKNVLTSMSLKISGKNSEVRLESAKSAYREIERRYALYLKSQNCKSAIELFDSFFPNCKEFTQTKKIDWFLWSFSKDELKKFDIFKELICTQDK